MARFKCAQKRLPMIRLSKALAAWQIPAFKAVLKAEIEHLDANLLPLQEGLSQSSHANADKLSAMILSVVDEPDYLRVKAGLFYTGTIAGCSCADDPTPVNEINEYCEVRFDIDKKTAETTVTLLRE
ncbi:MAG: hypothetical protein Q8Q28_07015 [Pseudomonadota bacterium]|nr:hypothetical protein [Pseudomonadota bacterium]